MSQHPRPASPNPRSLSFLAKIVGAEEPPADVRAVEVRGVTLDSRQVRPGDLYAALAGERTHGAAFAKDAAAAGAVAIITDRLGRERSGASGLPLLVVPDPRAVLGRIASDIYDRPSEDMTTLAVTGTNGKTTTAYLLESGLRAAGLRTGLLGTVETRIGDEALPSIRTTPEAPELHALLGVMVDRKVEAVAMEVSSHALALHRVDGVQFTVALFTNLSHDHLDFHFSLESYFLAKAELFTAVRAKAAVVNLDDEYGRRLVAKPQIVTTTYSASGADAADWRATGAVPGPGGTEFTVLGPGGLKLAARVALPGDFNVANALGAIATLVTAGVDPEAAVRGVGECPGVPGRMERIQQGQEFLAVVDYAHTPDAIATLLAALRPVTSGRIIAVVGAGGDRDKAKRPLMGEAAAAGAEIVVLTDDNPRSEDPAAIMAALRSGALKASVAHGSEVIVQHDRALAIQYAVGRADAGDTVVVAGKGHEQGQEAKGAVRPFDDRAVLAEALRSAREADA